MPLETLCLAYAGFASLAAANHRHRPDAPWPGRRSPRASLAVGAALLLLSAVAAAWRFGPVQAAVAWTGLASAAGILLVLLMSRWQRRALALWLPAALSGILIILTTL